jgi:hypothetical protein
VWEGSVLLGEELRDFQVGKDSEGDLQLKEVSGYTRVVITQVLALSFSRRL